MGTDAWGEEQAAVKEAAALDAVTQAVNEAGAVDGAPPLQVPLLL